MIELTPSVILEAKAKRFALLMHGTQKYGEHPYSYHLVRVVENVRIRMKDDPLLATYIAVAWLHDVLEDTDCTFKMLQDEFGLAIAVAVQALTKNDDLSYDAYMVNCCENMLAQQVKICDTMANLTESFKTNRKKGLRKYPQQLAILIAGVWAGSLVFYTGVEND